jgi:hypothetical protein
MNKPSLIAAALVSAPALPTTNFGTTPPTPINLTGGLNRLLRIAIGLEGLVWSIIFPRNAISEIDVGG